MPQHAPDVDSPEPDDVTFDLPDDGPPPPPPPPPIRRRALEALDRQIDTLERIAEDAEADYPHRLRAVEMLATLAGQEIRPKGPKHGPPPPGDEGPEGRHAAGKHAPAKHAAAKHAPGKHAAAKHAMGKHAASKHAAGKHAASKQAGAGRPDDADEPDDDMEA